MTNLYETLGVPYDSTGEQIELAYQRMHKFFDLTDPPQKSAFDDIKLAYKTLANEVSRAEYDEYISQNQRVNNFRTGGAAKEEEEDPEVSAERERRRKERGKKRYEEDYSFVNEEFFSSWQNRTKNYDSSYEAGASGE